MTVTGVLNAYHNILQLSPDYYKAYIVFRAGVKNRLNMI